MKATFRLMQESGVSGPTTTREVESPYHALELASVWAEGQTGHPWDYTVVEIPELDYIAHVSPELKEYLVHKGDDEKIREVLNRFWGGVKLSIPEVTQRSGVPAERVRRWAELPENASHVLRERTVSARACDLCLGGIDPGIPHPECETVRLWIR